MSRLPDGRSARFDPTASIAVARASHLPSDAELEPVVVQLIAAALDPVANPAPARPAPTSPAARKIVRLAVHRLCDQGHDAIDACQLLAASTGIPGAAVFEISRTDKKEQPA